VHRIIRVAPAEEAPFDWLIMPLSEIPLLSAATSSRLSSPDIAERCPAFNLGEET
jgi:hypothetical protein